MPNTLFSFDYTPFQGNAILISNLRGINPKNCMIFLTVVWLDILAQFSRWPLLECYDITCQFFSCQKIQ